MSAEQATVAPVPSSSVTRSGSAFFSSSLLSLQKRRYELLNESNDASKSEAEE